MFVSEVTNFLKEVFMNTTPSIFHECFKFFMSYTNSHKFVEVKFGKWHISPLISQWKRSHKFMKVNFITQFHLPSQCLYSLYTCSLSSIGGTTGVKPFFLRSLITQVQNFLQFLTFSPNISQSPFSLYLFWRHCNVIWLSQ